MTLQEAKDKVAGTYLARYGPDNESIGYSNWKEFEQVELRSVKAGVSLQRYLNALNEAAEIYAESMYEQGLAEATSQACEEINKNYTPNTIH